ncbi:MAG: response regulator transcription factor [Acidobacteriota bacterium]
MSRPRVLLADDHRLVAEGLKHLLSEEFDLVGVVENGRALLQEAARLQPDVIVADITMPHLNGIDALEQLKKDDPRVKVVFLTMHREIAYARRALQAGALGYVLKHAAPEELLMAIRAALNGQKYLSPAIAGDVLDSIQRDPGLAADPVTSLTARQREILQLLAEGKSAKEAAAELGISTRTVESHKYEMMRAADIHNTAELVHFAIKHGIVEI